MIIDLERFYAVKQRQELSHFDPDTTPNFHSVQTIGKKYLS